ncbi:histidine kinase [Sphingopyxis sp. H038]|nr:MULTISPECIES: histidine kinase dimerization/phospho-acceptor domain-containing protein [unclassified Sphingopyxis]KTE02994.1 histidine kinase [Sphingopyxis sp. H012]KTE28978.1 histidine kinase [Sphingopyxis sp. H080]KTE35975.1 histidine kinase [Sphingopyxis sp. H038]KTE44790.1 histidine kinase [Sphingopyxis sp. H005]KTE47620.1 histidine kinase [Sphingopyxis sp. H077]KTE68885.1 histidine kinase [Sphingopyxis sp. H085]
MIATILRQAPADRRASITAWRQLTDILAQRGNQLSDDDIRRSLHALAVLRPRVPESVRRDCARAVARHGRFAPLVALYANDVPAVSAIMLRDARLAEADWLALLPATSAMARSVLAGRSDLPHGVYRALASLGSASVALPQPEAAAHEEPAPTAEATPEPASEGHPSQISELVRRIDKYQSTRTQPAQSRAPRAAFLFETGPDGVVHWVEGVTRGAVIGLSIAEAAYGGEPGTDGVAAGAFRQRAEIINARMLLEGTPAEAGEWRFSALPWFDPATGQFRGYRASARRPHRNEMPFGRPASEDSGDSIRQLIHELRSPLNAISGFAQIISGQMFGPVSHGYRGMAETIVADAASVQSIIDDLETAARSGSAGTGAPSDEVVDIGVVVTQVESELAALLADQRVDLSISRVGGPFLGLAGDADVRRMVGRLLTALVDVSEPGAILVGQLVTESRHDDMLQLRVVRPATIRFATAADLLDPGFSPEGEAPGAAVLSLGFSLRLVDSLARGSGGRLDIGHNALTLHLPSANSKAEVELEAQQGE